MGTIARSRVPGIDLLRTFAIFCVVLNHSVEQVYSLNLEGVAVLPGWERLFAFTGFTVGRVGVPCFLVITGYLLLDREYSPEQSWSFLKNNWGHLLLCTWIWFLIYDLVLVLTGTPVTMEQLAQHLLFFNPVQFSHVWYMPAILGLYLLIPIMANGLQKVPGNYTLVGIGVFSVYAFLVPTLNVVLAAAGQEGFGSQFGLGFSGGAYGLYLLMGAMVRKGCLQKVKTGYLLLLSLVCGAGAVFFQLWCYESGYEYNVWYDFPLLFVLGICLLEAASRLRGIPWPEAVRILSKYAFAVYLIHNLWLRGLFPRIRQLPFASPAKVAIAFVLSCMLSYLCSFGIGRIPKIGNYILYIRKPSPENKV